MPNPHYLANKKVEKHKIEDKIGFPEESGCRKNAIY
jgi:hypothetical protein